VPYWLQTALMVILTTLALPVVLRLMFLWAEFVWGFHGNP
jgi:hypothetical protein